MFINCRQIFGERTWTKNAINDFETNKSNIKTYFSITNSTSGGFKHFDASQ